MTGTKINDIQAAPKCTRPPEGWHCTRGYHADGPCAAVPMTSEALGSTFEVHETGTRTRTLADLREDPDFLRSELNAADKVIRHHQKRWGEQSARIGTARAELARERLGHRDTMRALVQTEGQLETVTELANQRLVMLQRFADLYHDAQKGIAVRDKFEALVEETIPYLPAVYLTQTD